MVSLSSGVLLQMIFHKGNDFFWQVLSDLQKFFKHLSVIEGAIDGQERGIASERRLFSVIHIMMREPFASLPINRPFFPVFVIGQLKADNVVVRIVPNHQVLLMREKPAPARFGRTLPG